MPELTSLVRPATFAVGIPSILAPFAVLIWPDYPGSPLVLAAFIVASLGFLGLSLLTRPSTYITTLSAFLTLGFLIKAIAHLVFDFELIEPVGRFNGSAEAWNTALGFATAGIAGSTLATMLCALLPVRATYSTMSPNRLGRRVLLIIFVSAMVLALLVYTYNYNFDIHRIGYPPGISLPPIAQITLSFLISWGFLLGILSITYWTVIFNIFPRISVIYVSMILGTFASITMGSRIQYLLYVFAALCAVAHYWPIFRNWRQLVTTASVAGLLFVVSLTAVTLERALTFLKNPEQSTVATSLEQERVGDAPVAANPIQKPIEDAPAIEQIQRHQNADETANSTRSAPPMPVAQETTSLWNDHRIATAILEVRRLVFMRWVGLEAVMTAAGAKAQLGQQLFVNGLTEDPSAGIHSIYQSLSGGKYDDVEYFTFLTLPGIIGIGSLSGQYVVIFIFVFSVALTGHFLEILALRVTDNMATAAVCGVGLAYFTVQMPFPWTVFVFALELAVASLALGLFWAIFRRVAGLCQHSLSQASVS